jgi:uncharacterized protein (DUF934 family)
MALWRDGGFAEDVWTTLEDSAPAPAKGAIIVSFARWCAEKETLAKRADPVGVAIAAGKEVVAALEEAAKRPLVALNFAAFGDGRAFSYAGLLRERYRFAGELRATGDVLLDEIPLMRRCGFDSFVVTNEATLRALKEGRLFVPPLRYQPSVGGHEAPAGARPWLRKAAG